MHKRFGIAQSLAAVNGNASKGSSKAMKRTQDPRLPHIAECGFLDSIL